MSGAGIASAAVTNLAIPGLKALATIAVMKYQQSQWEDMAEDQREELCNCLDAYCSGMNALIDTSAFSAAYGTIPEAAEYVPVDALLEQCKTINDNLQNVPAADRLMAAVNLMNRNDDLARMIFFCPAFLNNMHKVDRQIKDLLDGKVPIDSAANVLTNRAEQDALNGRTGNSCKMTARDFGILRISMQARGFQMMNQQAALINQVSPHARRMTIQDMLVKPEYRLGYAMTQHQLIQNSLQNKYNLDAAGDPSRMGEIQTKLSLLGTKLQFCAQKAALLNSYVPNYAAAIAPMVQALGNTYTPQPAQARVAASSPTQQPVAMYQDTTKEGAQSGMTVTQAQSYDDMMFQQHLATDYSNINISDPTNY